MSEERYEYSEGLGCTCGALSSGECGCTGIDWRSAREIQLEVENARMHKALTLLRDWILSPTVTLNSVRDIAREALREV